MKFKNKSEKRYKPYVTRYGRVSWPVQTYDPSLDRQHEKTPGFDHLSQIWPVSNVQDMPLPRIYKITFFRWNEPVINKDSTCKTCECNPCACNNMNGNMNGNKNETNQWWSPVWDSCQGCKCNPCTCNPCKCNDCKCEPEEDVKIEDKNDYCQTCHCNPCMCAHNVNNDNEENDSIFNDMPPLEPDEFSNKPDAIFKNMLALEPVKFTDKDTDTIKELVSNVYQPGPVKDMIDMTLEKFRNKTFDLTNIESFSQINNIMEELVTSPEFKNKSDEFEKMTISIINNHKDLGSGKSSSFSPNVSESLSSKDSSD